MLNVWVHFCRMFNGLPLLPEMDLLQTTHYALTQIATTRPSLFITSLAREVARFSAIMAAAQVSSYFVLPIDEEFSVLIITSPRFLLRVMNVVSILIQVLVIFFSGIFFSGKSKINCSGSNLLFRDLTCDFFKSSVLFF